MGRNLVTLDGKRQLYLQGFTLTKTGLVYGKSVTRAQWEDAGDVLSHIHQTTLWWIGDWLTCGEDRKWVRDDKYEGVKERFGIEEPTARVVVHVSRRFEMLRRRNKLSWSHHREVAGLPEPEQEHWLDRAEEEGWSKSELRRQIKAALPPPALDDVEPGRYRVIYADPPWEYNDERGLEIGKGSAAANYPVLPLEKICEMDVKSKASSNSALFLWTTSPLLLDAKSVIDAWGFVYKASFVWDKVNQYIGHYSKVRHELLLLATRGSCVPESKAIRDSIIVEKKTRHSRKPDAAYEMIEAMYPVEDPPIHLELFARKNRPGWTPMGNEIDAAPKVS